MVDEILIPGTPGASNSDSVTVEESLNYLIKDNYLSEFETELDKEIARQNLGVHNKEDVYTKTEVDSTIKKETSDQMKFHLAEDDPHKIMVKIDHLLQNLIKIDGTTPFTAPQTGVNPIFDYHLTTKKFVTDLLNAHVLKEDPHNTMTLVRNELQAYVEKNQVYLKRELYTKTEVDKLLKPYVINDGSTPFNRPQVGVTPILDNHLATKKYVDKTLYDHLVEADPHQFITILNQRLAKFYSKNETYSKAETYSRSQIDSLVYKLVLDAAKSALEEHINQSDPHNILSSIQNNHYITRDGSVGFTAVQKGVEGVADNDLIVLSQLNKLKDSLESQINDSQPIWKTSGPAQVTVGFIESEAPMPIEMSFQETMDAIFYGKVVEVTSLPITAIGSTPEVNMFVRGTGLVSQAYLYQNDELIGTFNRYDFESGQCKVNAKPILEDTEFRFQVEFYNGPSLSATWKTKVSYGVFVGLLPKWVFGSVVTYDYLMSLVDEDPYNNIMSGDYSEYTSTIKHKFSFTSPDNLKHIILAMPKDYPSLEEMVTPSQHFGVEAFDVIDEIPFKIPGIDKDVIFKIYIYREALAAFNSEITFKLTEHE